MALRKWLMIGGIVVAVLAVLLLFGLFVWPGWLTKGTAQAAPPAATPQATQAVNYQATIAALQTQLDDKPAATPQPTAQPTPQPAAQTPCHPSQYVETGSSTMTWTQEVPADSVLIIGGYTVNEKSGGVYRAVKGPAKVTVKVTDGFVLTIDEKCANREFCFRINEAKQNGWAHNVVEPLPGWVTCQ